MRKLTFDDTLKCGAWIGVPVGVLVDRLLMGDTPAWGAITTALAILCGVAVWQWRKS